MLALAVSLLGVNSAVAATVTTAGSGNWNSTTVNAPWPGGVVPASTNDVVIRAGDSITVAADASINSITFSNNSTTAATLTVNSGITLTVTTGVTMQNSSDSFITATITGAGTINCAFATVGGTVTSVSKNRTTILTSTISNWNVIGNLTIRSIDSSGTDNNVTLSLDSGALSVGGSVVLNADGGATSTFTLASGSQNGTLTLPGATSFSTPGGGTATFTANGTGATVVYSGGAQTVRPVTYQNLTLSGSGAKTMTGVSAISGNLTLSGTVSATLATALAVNGSVTIGPGTILDPSISNFGLAVGSNWSNSGTFTLRASTVTFNGTANQSVSGTTTFSSLTVNNVAGITLSSSETVTNVLTLTSGTVSGAANLTLGDGATISRATGSLSGTPTFGTSVNVTYTSGGVTTGSELPASTTALQALNINNASGTVTMGADVTVNGNFTTGANATVSDGGFVLAVNSTVSHAGIHTSTGGGKIRFAGAAAQAFSGDLGNVELANAAGTSLNGTTSINGTLQVTSGAFTVGAFGLTVSGATTVSSTLAITSTTGTKTFAGVNISGGIWTNSANEDVTIGGDLLNSGTFVAGTGTYTFNGGAANIGGASVLAFANVTVSAGAKTLTNSISLTGSLNISGGSLDLGAFTANRTAAGGTLTVASGTTLKIGGTGSLPSNYTTHSIGATSTVDYSGSNQSIAVPNSSQAYGNLATSGSGTKTLAGSITVATVLTVGSGTTLDASTATLALSGAGTPLVVNGSFTPSNSTVSYTHNGGGTVTGGINYYNLTINNSGDTFTANAGLTVQNVLTIASGTTFSASGFTITLSGSGTPLVVTGTVTPSTSTYAYTSGTGATVAGITYSNLRINGAATFALGANATVNTTLTLTSGILATGANTLTIPSGGSVSGASSASYVTGNLQKGFGTAGNPQSFTFPIGSGSTYAPVSLTSLSVTTAGNIRASTTAGSHPQSANDGLDPNKNVNRYWTLTNSPTGIVITTNTVVTFNYPASDVDGAATSAFFAARRWNGSAWSTNATSGTPSSTAMSITVVNSFGDFDMGNQLVNSVVFTQQPATTTASQTMAEVKVQPRDVFNVAIPGSSVSLTLNSGTLNGTTNQSADSTGTATFGDLSINQAGTNKQLTATSGSKTTNSTTFTINAGPASKLGFTTQPVDTTAGSTMANIVVQIQDSLGNSVSSSNVPVTLSVTGGFFSGTLTRNTDTNGRATFNDLVITLAGAGKTMSAAASGLTGASSSAFNINVGAFAKLQVIVPGEIATPGTASGKTGTPGSQTVAVPFNISVNAVDANWNLVSTNDTVRITSSDVLASLPANAALVGGTNSFSVTLMSAGSSTVTASNVTHTNIASNTSPTITVAKGNQIINFNSLADKTYGDAPFAVSATASSGLLVSFSIATGPASVVGNTVTIVGAGGVTVGASQAGDANWNPAPDVHQSFTVAQKPLIGSITADSKIYDGTNTATIASRSLTGVISPDVVSLVGGTASFDDKNVGSNKVVTATGLGLGGGDAIKYALVSTSATNTADITAKGLTVSGVTADNKVYDSTTAAVLHAGSAMLVGMVIGDSLSLETSAVAGSFADRNVGTGKTVTATGLALSGGDAGDYLLTQPTMTADITQATVTGSFTADDKVYDGTNTANIATRSLLGVFSPDVVSLTGGAATFDDKNVGNAKTVVVSGLELSGTDATNYALASTSATNTANITAQTLTVTATGVDKAYDGTTAATVNLSDNRIANDVLTVTASAAFADKNVGSSKTVNVSNIQKSGADAGNYALASTTSSTTANITPLTLTVTANDASRYYGAPNPDFTASYSGFVTNEGVVDLSGALSLTTTATQASLAGTYAITAAQGTLGAANYVLSFVNGSLLITDNGILFADDFGRDTDPESLISPWTAHSGVWSVTGSALKGGPNAASTYGFALVDATWTNYSYQARIQFPTTSAFGAGIGGRLNPTTGAHYAAWVYPDGSPSAIGGNKLALVKFRTWELWGYTNGNFFPMVVTNLPSVGTGPHTVKLVFDGGNISIVYDGVQMISTTDAELTPLTGGGISVDMWTDNLTPYQLTVDDVVVTTPAAQTINFATLGDKTYGDAPFAVNATATSGLPVTFSLVSGPATLSSNIVTITGAGAVIVRASQGGNEIFTPAPDVDRSFTVNPAVLTVVADGDTRLYGEANPAFNGTLIGVVNNDDITATYFSSADETTSVGNYDVVPTLVDAGSRLTNYTVASTNGVLSITPAALRVTADSTSRIYGSANPTFTGSLVGVLNNDGILASYSTVADETSSVGNYDIIPSLLDPNSRLSNYIVASTNGVLTITPAALSVTANNVSRGYGDANPIFSGSLLGVLNNDGIAASYSTVAGTNSPVGNYDIVPTLIDINNRLGNYTVASTNGSLSVLPASLLVTADNQSRAFGATNPVLTVSYSGFVNGETVAVLSGAPDVTASADTNGPIGSYEIVIGLGSLSNANYSFGFSNGTMTVTTAALLITADNQSRVYGSTNPVLTVSYSGFVNGEGAGDLGGTPSVITSADPTSSVGNYDIEVSLGSLSNTNYTYSFSNGTLNVTAASLSVTADSTSRIYGSANPAFTGNLVGVLNNDGITASYSTSADETSPVGNYDIVPSLSDPNSRLSNYVVASTNGVLTITPAALSVTADNATRIYGLVNPPFTGNVVGVLNNDGITASYSTVADETSPVGNNDIVPSLNDPNNRLGNYSVASTNGVLSITPAALSVTANNASRGYGEANPIFSGSLLGVLNNDGITASYSTVAGTNSPVGNYDIVPTLIDVNNRLGNYTVSSTNGVLLVTPAALLVTADNQSRAFGATNPVLTVSYSGFVNGETSAVLSGVPDVTTAADTNSPIGSYEIVVSLGSLSNANYSFGFSNGTLTVTTAALLVAADNQSRTYGAANPTLSVSYSGFVNGEGAGDLGGTPSVITSADPTSSVGNYEIVVSLGSLSNTNYAYSFSNGTLNVTAASLSVAADSTSKVYGSANPAFTGNLVGALNNDGIIASYSTVADETSPVGNYDIIPSLSDPNNRLSNYIVASTNGVLSITPAALSVTADNATRIYGSANPAFTGNVVGVLNNDGITASYSTVADETSPVGNYDIVPSLSDPNNRLSNYIVASTNGVLSITPAALSVTANNASRGYGEANPIFSGSLLGVLNNDGITASYSTVAGTNSPVGNYDIVPTLIDVNNRLGNYTVSSTNGVLLVTPAALLVTADNQSRAFGATNPVLTVSYSGFVNGETSAVLSGVPDVTTAADTNSPIGSYEIVVSLGSLSNANYSFGFSNGTLTVTTAALLVAADNQSRTYGAANPTLSVSYSGFVNGEGAGDLGGTPSVITSADPTSSVGNYDIEVSLGSLSNTNYAYSFSNGTFNVTAASLSVTADSTTKIYGSANPTLTGNVLGVLNNDGIIASYSTSADETSPVGNYDIVPSLSDPNNKLSNYIVASTNGVLSITPAALSVTADDATRIYGSANPAFTGNLAGVFNNDGITASYSTVAEASSPVGNYDIVPSLQDPNSRLGNYIVASTNGVLSITPAALGVTANNAIKAYGSANPALTGNLVGVLNNDGITASYSTVAGTNSPVGNYDIIPTLLDVNNRLGNYIVASTNGTLNVLPAALLVTADNQSRVYGASNPALTVTYSGFVNGDTVAVLTGASDVTTVADTNSIVGSYDIVASLGTLSNANYSFGFSNGTLTVTVAELLITAENQSRMYGATNPALTVNYSGFVNGEGAGSLAGSPSVTTTATTNSPIGNYDIVVGLGSLNNANYSYIFSNATLSVTAASLSVTADSTSRVYGSANPEFTGNVVGVLNNDGITASYATVADASSPVGTYDIVPSLSDPNGRLANYTVASTNGVLTVTPAALSVTANNASRAYGVANPAFGGSLVGVLNSDGITASYATAADANSPVGVYDIVPSLNDPNSRLVNYSVASTNGVLTVTAGIASINWSNPADIVFGTALGVAQLNASGSVPGALVYTPEAGAVLNVGNAQQLSVMLTPTDTNYANAQASVFINVLASGSVMALTTSTNQALPGSTVTFTATMAANPQGTGTPTGNVQFVIDGSPVGAPVALTSGEATFSTSTLTHGTHMVAAVYGGDSNFTGTTNSLSPDQVINTPPTAPTYFIFTTQDTPVAFSAENVMVAVTDPDGDATNLTSVSATSTNGGTAALESGMITFSPLAGSTNQDTFAYTVTDALGGSTTGFVSVVVVPAVGAPPTAPVTMLSSGHAMLALSAVAGDTYIVQGSADLHTWVNLSRLVAGPDGKVRMEDGDATAYPARYYRLIIP